ncbi:phosphate/phosphite/phosphonate ABC transporter substrate-binding protein [Aliiruegeria sabulilitoris]|uniref:phosphate/phosphite/phosphonate ABC transporter substrate-binding protein n=1 Tax=Aliiruegeria sabulilitoris TaxID=1510458 RepID=UPI00083205FE|nr:phosphate/phosphite/phosphonate ABC transporter substrate-binding protein [Aliiruegeria sabulilitoris]NDR59103.1 phosphate/phosphite/phosphonate ABC transporter substrate-binding protein [Pseudoruegeria sp. M32A2M]
MSLKSVLGALALALGVLASQASAEVLVLGSVNDNVRKHVKRFSPLAEYLQAALVDQGVDGVEISVYPNSAAMADALASGKVDFYFDSPVVAAKVSRQAGAIPVLRRWKRGVASYHSVIVVPTASDVQGLGDLVGRKIGFQDSDSTSGFLLPLGMILRENLPILEIANHETKAPEDAIGYVFTRDDKNTILWLSRGWIDAAATDPKRFRKLEEAFPGQYRELARSIDVPRQAVIRSPRTDPALAETVCDVLIAMDESPQGREVLDKFHKTSQFDRFPEGGEATFSPIYQLLDDLDRWDAAGS